MLYCPCQPNPIKTMKCSVFFNTNRTGYSPDQIHQTLTVQEIIDVLSGFEPNAKVYFRNDEGYTYGSISYQDINEEWTEGEDENEE